jgi:hypothetical protein
MFSPEPKERQIAENIADTEYSIKRIKEISSTLHYQGKVSLSLLSNASIAPLSLKWRSNTPTSSLSSWAATILYS